MLKKLQRWWQGDEYYIEGIIPGIRFKRHWTAKIARSIVDFYLKNWQWCLGFAVAVISLSVAIIKLG